MTNQTGASDEVLVMADFSLKRRAAAARFARAAHADHLGREAQFRQQFASERMGEAELRIGGGDDLDAGLGEVARFVGADREKPSAAASTMTKLSPP